jgi:hypothetical protein
VVLRLYNASNDYVEGRVKLFFPMARAELATLAEAAVQEIDVEDGGALKLDVRPHKIVTIRVRPAQR